MMKILPAIALLSLFSCTAKTNSKSVVEYTSGRQLLTLNQKTKTGESWQSPEVGRIARHSALIDEEYLVKIFLKDTTIDLIDAYVGCVAVDNPSVDTAAYTFDARTRLSGCEQGLVVKNDTIYIGFTPKSPGMKTFEEITLLTRDDEKIFRTQKYVFDFLVVEK
ncbi:hypothetical protein [Chryseolinea lacunae]|uniref:Lipoprotein n=1 Tax=Chryseolinea lacunae TaxID=2801331 RepID=A0ABS1L2P6_9BACT|nr:hypothetical protein [Chryseolinea lacunae]MBL0745960.1 hypothetical protein [Chryseolinea lacunae]